MTNRISKWLGLLVREVRGNALWDLIKLIVIAAFAFLVVALYRVAAWARGIPQDRIIDVGIFVTAVLLMGVAYALSRRRVQPVQIPSKTVFVPVQPTQEPPDQDSRGERVLRQIQFLLTLMPTIS